MRTITDITPQKNKMRVNLYLDGEFYAGILLETVMLERLKVGNEIDENRLQEVILENEKRQGLNKALALLSGAMKTEGQIKKYLNEKGFSPLAIPEIISKLKEMNYINDLNYAREYILCVKDKKGKNAIYQDLLKRLADKRAIEIALSEMENSIDALKMLYEKYVRGKEMDEKLKAKTIRYLMGKGFSYDEVSSLFKGE